MRLYSESLEISALFSICGKSEEVRSVILTSVKDDWFHFEPVKAAYSRVVYLSRKRGIVPSWSEVLEDLTLSEDFRDILKESTPAVCKNARRASRLVEKLNDYRKARLIYYVAKDALAALKGDSVDIDQLVDKISDAASVARSNQQLDKLLVHFGGDDNDFEEFIAHTFDKDADKPLLSGFKDIDDGLGGLPSTGVLLLGATTSGGKSTFLLNLLLNILKLNKVSCAMVSLEMDKRKNGKRLASRLTQIPLWKFKRNNLSDAEEARARKEMKRLHRFLKKYELLFSFLCPDFAVDIDSVLALAKPYRFRVLGIDYVSLLEGVDEDNQARILSSIVRQCKIYSAANDCLVIPLVQLDGDSGKIRYSRGMLEHADMAIIWKYNDPAVRDTKRLPMEIAKNRDGELGKFELEELFETMTIRDCDDAAGIRASEQEKAPLEETSVDYEAGQS